MRLIVSSKSDQASMNIREKLLGSSWECPGEFMGNPYHRKGDDILITVEEHHIYFDEADRMVSTLIEEDIDLVVFISKHASKAGIHSLTVHPVGNFGKAKFGGRDHMLVPPAPEEMRFALGRLREGAKKVKKNYQVSLEVTHHGPYLTTPTYYIEIGSDEVSWTDDEAGEIVAAAVREQGRYRMKRLKRVVCLGGGHYAPHFTDMVKEKEVSVGHLIPGWALKDLTRDGLQTALEQSGTDLVCVDPGGIEGGIFKTIKAWCGQLDAEIVEVSDI